MQVAGSAGIHYSRSQIPSSFISYILCLWQTVKFTKTLHVGLLINFCLIYTVVCLQEVLLAFFSNEKR